MTLKTHATCVVKLLTGILDCIIACIATAIPEDIRVNI